ncbi:MAG: hypothetical protein BMS9Abin28_0780 [Anaerolineae bacterium]|nr:MAG: hypothetical protein BMS9Abin28_0780 [Anaerolineae bacterium]
MLNVLAFAWTVTDNEGGTVQNGSAVESLRCIAVLPLPYSGTSPPFGFKPKRRRSLAHRVCPSPVSVL